MKIIGENIDELLARQERYVADSYAQFLAFGGPCVYFHVECLKEAERSFLSQRHVELIYATLTAWGMHRMGDSEKTKTKLTDWPRFLDSIHKNRAVIEKQRNKSMRDMTLEQYVSSLQDLRSLYKDLDLTMSDSTLVVNSKAMFHLWPDFIPPIDRQYTIRFLTKPQDKWMTPKKRFKTIMLPKGKEKQFAWFVASCSAFKKILDRVRPDHIDRESQRHKVTPPKIIDNAIVCFVRGKSGRLADMA